MTINPDNIKKESEALILKAGGEICSWLPIIELEEIKPRSARDIANRALVLHAFVNASFGAPLSVLKAWLEKNNLANELSPLERKLIYFSEFLNEEQINQFRWNIEFLWVAAWCGQFFNEFSPTQPVSEELAGFFPSIKDDEAAESFYSKFKLRQPEDLYKSLDHLYRAHWFTKNCQLTGTSSGNFNGGVVQCRRMFIEWVLNHESEWDHMELNT